MSSQSSSGLYFTICKIDIYIYIYFRLRYWESHEQRKSCCLPYNNLTYFEEDVKLVEFHWFYLFIFTWNGWDDNNNNISFLFLPFLITTVCVCGKVYIALSEMQLRFNVMKLWSLYFSSSFAVKSQHFWSFKKNKSLWKEKLNLELFDTWYNLILKPFVVKYRFSVLAISQLCHEKYVIVSFCSEISFCCDFCRIACFNCKNHK